MQIMIDIPEKLACAGFERPFTEEEKNTLIKAIGNGKPLPKGHGDLVDRDAIWHAYDYSEMEYTMINALDDAPTIIEADRAERSDKE